MKLRTTAAVAAICTSFVAGGVAAQEFTWNYGVDVTSNYVFAGETQSDGDFAIQPWAEVQFGGAYLGFWGSTVDFGDDDNMELDLFVGYRGDINDALSYDVGLARYAYDNSYYSGSEAYGSMTYGFAGAASVTGYVAYDWEDEYTHAYVAASYDLKDDFSIDAKYGQAEGMDSDYYWEIGATYAISDVAALDVRYHGVDGMSGGSKLEDQGVVATVSFAF